jgi:hypothetical protein
MTRTRRLVVIVGVFVIAALLAFPLRETIYDAVIVPVAFLGWGLGLMYQSLSQSVWWWAIVLIVVFMLLLSLVPRRGAAPRRETKSKPKVGQVEELAGWLRRVKGGTYFKWLVANRLGKLAYQMLLYRENGRPRSVFAPLSSPDWKPSKELQTYLEIGLHGSFADFPHSGSRFGTLPKTPLDHEVREAIEFLESQLEDKPR